MKVLIGQTDGLPNITGNYSFTSGPSIAAVQCSEANGALYPYSSGTNYYAGSPYSGNSSWNIGFDASKINKIYGNSNYVRIKNLSSKIWLRNA